MRVTQSACVDDTGLHEQRAFLACLTQTPNADIVVNDEGITVLQYKEVESYPVRASSFFSAS